jgi:pilus assembly protein CpaF
MRLEELLERRDVEDIVLSPAGISCFAQGSWTGPEKWEGGGPAELQTLARHIAEQACSTLGLTQPSVDAFLHLAHQTFRAHVVIPPMVLSGPEITLRRLPVNGARGLVDFCDSDRDRARLSKAVREGASFLISGSTGSGKTSLLTALLNLLPESTRTLILEDSPEIPVPNPLSSKLVARTNRFGFRSGAAWDLSHLVYESLRMRPDRLILGECRGPEALAIARALQTGHAGMMTTLHAGSTTQALERFQELATAASGEKMAPDYRPLWNFVVQIDQAADGSRRIQEILEQRS